MAYQSTAEWPVAAASVSALVAGGWGSALRRSRERAPAPTPAPEHAHA
jgi:hypothetical protein